MQDITGVVIACAGMGTRVGLGMPKCMIEIDGQTILTRLVNMLKPHIRTIHLVVGYREDMVINYCAQHHRDVVLVRNPEFRDTRASFSLSKGARHLKGKILFMDGDLLVEPQSMTNFLAAAQSRDLLIGLTEAKSENAVYAQGQESGNEIVIEGFSRESSSDLEWANVFVGPHDMLDGAPGFVFERLAEHLPLYGKLLNLAEIDTADDLVAARQFFNRPHS